MEFNPHMVATSSRTVVTVSFMFYAPNARGPLESQEWAGKIGEDLLTNVVDRPGNKPDEMSVVEDRYVRRVNGTENEYHIRSARVEFTWNK